MQCRALTIWYHSKPSDIPFFPNQFQVGTFFAASYSKTALPSYGITPKPRTSAFFSLHHNKILDRKFQPSANPSSNHC